MAGSFDLPPTLDKPPTEEPAPGAGQKPASQSGVNLERLQAQASKLTVMELTALVRADQFKRWRRGERVLVETYLAQMPSLCDNPESVLDLVISEVVLREEAGDIPPIDEYLHRFPQYESQIYRRLSLYRASSDVGPQTESDNRPDLLAETLDRLQATGAYQDVAFSMSYRDDRAALLAETLERPVLPRPGKGGAKVPRHVAGYEILGVLGRGGMGVVYKAEQVKLKRLVALKMILGGVHASPDQLARFRIEAEAVARVQHPNIVQIYEIGEADGYPYLSLEFVDGCNLGDKLDGTPLPVKEAAWLVETLARAVHIAHQQGIVHRDLKPANVLLSGPPDAPVGQCTPKITDFGLAKQLGEEAGQTQSGQILGTPSYMAPEQAAGHSRDISPATDVYALGAILYESMTGRPPFRGTTLMATLEQVRDAEPVPPVQLQPGLPRDLGTICLKCLEKEPRRRYPSAQALAEDLRRFLAGEPIFARATPACERVWKWAQRRPALAAMTAAIIGITLVGLSLVSWQWLRAEEERQRAITFAAAETKAKHDIEDKNKQLEIARRRAENERLHADRRSASLLREKGVSQCEQGNYGAGMLWLARGLEINPSEAGDLDQSIRTLLGGWSRHICPIKAVFDHPQQVSCVAISPDGRTLLTGCRDSSARQWDIASGKLIGKTFRHSRRITTVAYSPDGKFLLTGSVDQIACLWNRDTGECWHRFQHPRGVSAIVFSPDGRTVMTGCYDGAVRLWDATTGKLVASPIHHKGWISSAVFGNDGGMVLSGGSDQAAWLWDARNQAPSKKAWPHPSPVLAVALSPDGKTGLTGCLDGTVRLWDTATGRPLGSPLQLRGKVSAVAFSPDGQAFLTACEDGTAQLWDMVTRQPWGEPLRHQAGINAVAFSTDSKTVATGSSDKTARCWDVSRRLPLGQPMRQTGPLEAAVFSPDSRTIITAGADHTAQLWDGETGRPIGQPLRHDDDIVDVRFSPDGKTVLTRTRGRTVRLWDAATGKPVGQSLKHLAVIHSAVFSPDSKIVLTASADLTAQLWDAATGKPRGKPMRHNSEVQFALFSPDGQTILTGQMDLTVRLWSATTGQAIGRPLVQEEPVLNGIFSPDGKRILIRAGNSARLWDVASGKPIGKPLRHQAAVNAAAFAPNGQVVLTGSLDKTARLWDAATGKPLTIPLDHKDGVFYVAFSPDGKTCLTMGGNSVRIWEAATGKPIGEPLRHQDQVTAAVFSPDSRLVLTAGYDRSVRLWDTAMGKLAGGIWHETAVLVAGFSPDRRTCLVGGANGVARVWPVLPPMRGDVENIKLWIEANTELEIDATGAVVPLSLAVWEQRWRTARQMVKKS